MKGSGGKLIAPTNRQFHVEFYTVAHWKNGEIVEEKLFYDLVGLLKQIGVMWGFVAVSLSILPWFLVFSNRPQSPAGHVDVLVSSIHANSVIHLANP